jgi:uncharacterized Fe-S cluster protein YjdI/CDGSH-type Zn-finger protein
MSIETVAGKSATIEFNGQLCIHARRCVLSQPSVFKANVEGPWIDPDAASAEALEYVALNCPSGAIRVSRHDGGANEASPKVNTISVRENGPLAISAEIVLAGAPIGTRATLCRCGESKNKPYCDGSHSAAAFAATGEPATKESVQLASRDGPLEISPIQTDRLASPARSRSFRARDARSIASRGPRSADAVIRPTSPIATARTPKSGSSRLRG